jgi:hypothetical protein
VLAFGGGSEERGIDYRLVHAFGGGTEERFPLVPSPPVELAVWGHTPSCGDTPQRPGKKQEFSLKFSIPAAHQAQGTLPTL